MLAQFYCFAWSTLRWNFAQRYRSLVSHIFVFIASTWALHRVLPWTAWIEDGLRGARSKLWCSGFRISRLAFNRHAQTHATKYKQIFDNEHGRRMHQNTYPINFWCSLFHDHGTGTYTRFSHNTKMTSSTENYFCYVVKNAIHFSHWHNFYVQQRVTSQTEMQIPLEKWFLF